jgi:hypothetical protein
MTRGRLLVVLAAIVLTSAAQADRGKQDEAAERKACDAVLYKTLRDVINRGVDLYNGGDPAACYRVYEGSLATIEPLLAHHPDLQKVIARALASAERDPVAWRRAFTLRNALDKVRAGLKRGTKPSKIDDDRREKLPQPQTDQDR